MTSLRARAFLKCGIKDPLEIAKAGEHVVTQILVRFLIIIICSKQ